MFDSIKQKTMNKKFLISSVLAVATLISISLFWDDYVVAMSLLVVIGFFMILNERTVSAVFLYAAIFVLGLLVEVIAIHFGAWSYTIPQFIGISAWLLFAWGNAALFIQDTNEFIVSRWKKARG